MARKSSPPMIDPFLLWLIGTVTAASLLPARGFGAEFFNVAKDAAIALLFFLHGAKLSRKAIMEGIGNWKLHLMVFASTFILFPLAGLVTVHVARHWIDPILLTGILFLTLLPSTVQSSIAFTAIARGNVAAAVCSASLSNLMGIVLTPVLAGLLIASSRTGHGWNWHAVNDIVMQLLVPFLSGHFLRPLIGQWVDKHKAILMPVDRGSILLVVYSAFSAAVVNGIWKILDFTDLLILLGLSGAILGFILVFNAVAARVVGLPRENAVVLLFCGSKKSLVTGVPMAGALFAPAQVGTIVLPLMIFHQLQLFVCAIIAGRLARDGSEPMAEAEVSPS